MSQFSSHGVRVHALAAATALVLSSSVVVAAAHAAGRMNVSGLQSAEKHDRFIVKHRENSVEHTSATSLQKSLSNAAAASGQGKGKGLGLGLQRLRRIATGAEVVHSHRKLDRVEAEQLISQLAADPNVEYVEVDKFNKPIITPNDTRYSEQGGYSGTYGIKAPRRGTSPTAEVLNGTWKLRVNDNTSQDTGYINSWSVTF